jgi:hypothetical protein
MYFVIWFFIVVYLTTPSLTQTVYLKMLVWLVNNGYGRMRSGSSLRRCPCILLEELKVNHLNCESAEPVAELPAARSYTHNQSFEHIVSDSQHSDQQYCAFCWSVSCELVINNARNEQYKIKVYVVHRDVVQKGPY